MANIKPNWVKNPTKRQALIVFFGWLIGATLIIISLSNFFTEPIFNRRYTIVLLLLLGSTSLVVAMSANYFKHRAKTTESPNIY